MPENRKEFMRKVIGVELHKDATGRQVDGSLIVKGFFLTEGPDTLGDVITRDATAEALPDYRKWGNIRYMHQARPVGKVLRIGNDDSLDWNEVEIKVIDPQAVFEVENGLLSGLSVGILIDWEDMNLNEYGGWTVNRYTLAEISLVDHPAFAGAELTDIGKSPEALVLMRALGPDAIRGGKPMQKDASQAPVAEAPVEAATPAPVEEPIVEEPVAEEPVMAVAPVAEPEVAEEPVSVETETPAPEPVGDEVPAEGDLMQMFVKAIGDLGATLTAQIENLAKSLQSAPETEAETPAQEEPAEGEAAFDLVAEIKSISARLEALEKKPANRTAKVAAGDDLPHEEIVPEEKFTEPEGTLSLRTAVQKYVTNHPTV